MKLRCMLFHFGIIKEYTPDALLLRCKVCGRVKRKISLELYG